MLIFFLLSFSFNALAQSTLVYEAQNKNIKLTENDKEILEIGEISTGSYIVGGILGTYPLGFGLGHAVQGRWSQKGWIFTAGELGSLTMVVAGLLGCVDKTFSSDDCSDVENVLISTGLISFVGLRLWEIVDVWAAPPSHNRKYNELKEYINKQPEKTPAKVTLDLVPVINPGLGQGLALKLNF